MTRSTGIVGRDGQPWRPKELLSPSRVRTRWFGVVCGSRRTGPPGISHLVDTTGTHVWEYRDEDGDIHGVVVWRSALNELFLMTDPERRRQGICLQLLEAAERDGVAIDFRQSYTRAGWATVRAFLRRRRARETRHAGGRPGRRSLRTGQPRKDFSAAEVEKVMQTLRRQINALEGPR